MRTTTEEEKRIKKRFGEIIREEREATGLSLRKLSQKIDIAYQTLSLYERGENMPSKKNLSKIVQVLDIDIEGLKETDYEVYKHIQKQMRLMDKEKEKASKLLGDNHKTEVAKMMDQVDLLLQYINQKNLNASLLVDEWITIPIFSEITNSNIAESKGIIGETRIPSEWLYGEHTFFGLKVSDDRNSPYFLEGDILIAQEMDENYHIGNGEFIIFMINGSSARVGRYHTVGNQITISYVNENYKAQDISVFDTLKIIGIVKEDRRRIV